MIEVPSTAWVENGGFEFSADDLPVSTAPPMAVLGGTVRHTFTHFHLELRVAAGRTDDGASYAGGLWVPPSRFAEFALPTVMKKVCRHALAMAADDAAAE